MTSNALPTSEVRTVTVCLFGDEKVGKTTFISRISQRSSLEGTVSIGMLNDEDQPFVFHLRRGPKEYRLEFYDTSAPMGWQNLEPDLAVVCYDISRRMSLINLQRVWAKEIKQVFGFEKDTLPIAVLGLKRDLRSETDPNGIIYPQEGTKIAQEMRADAYMECSSVTGELVEMVVRDLFALAVKSTTEEGGQTEGTCAIM